MASIKELIQSIEAADSSFDEKLAAINQMEETLVAMRQQEEEAINDNVDLIVEAIKVMEDKVNAQLEIAKSIVPEKGDKGDKGKDGKDGKNGLDGKDGRDGRDGKDGIDGKDGVSVTDAKIDFDGSLIISLSTGQEINVGEVVASDLREKIHHITTMSTNPTGNLSSITSNDGSVTVTTVNNVADLSVAVASSTTNVICQVRNTTGATLTKGTAVYISGATGQIPTVSKALATSDATSAQTLGLMTADLANNTNGYVTVIGLITNIDTSSYTDGAQLYLSGTTAGTLTATKTYAPTHLVYVAVVEHAHPTQGKLFVKVQNGYELDEIHNVSAQSPTTGQTIVYNSSTSLWEQSNAPVISGTTINNTTIGGTTPAAGTFTTLTGNSTSQFGRSSANYMQAVGGATTVAPVLSAQGSDTNIPLVLQPKGTGAIQAQLTDSTATGGNARGANAVDWQTIRSTASQVASGTQAVISGGAYNAVSGGVSFIGGGSSNSSPGYSSSILGGTLNTVGATGNFISYGVVGGGQSNSALGSYNFVGGGFTNSGTASAAVTTQSGTMNGTTAVTLSGSNASIKVGQYITGTSIAGDTYVAAISGTSLTLSKNASGSSTSTLSFYTPHGVVVGGGNNQATGSYSFIGGGGDAGTAGNRNVASGDWSFVGGGRNNTVSGSGSFLGGGGYYAGLGTTNNGNTITGDSAGVISGLQNNASGFASFIGAGQGNVANSSFSTSLGAYGSTRGIQGYIALSASYTPIGTFVAANSQGGLLLLGRQTTDATATILTSNTSAASGINQIILPNNSAYYFRGEIIAGVTGAGNTKGWYIEGVIKRGANAASTALVGTPTVTSNYADAGASTWAVTATADTTNGGLAITVTGQASTTIRWVAQVRTTEMTY